MAKAATEDIGKFILTYDPEKPRALKDKFTLTLPETAEEALPTAIPWPASAIPTPEPLTPAPAETDDLSRFKGYDAVVVTWKSAEAASLARLEVLNHTNICCLYTSLHNAR